MTPLENVLSKLVGVKKSGKEYLASCPAHEDHNPSLSIKSGDDGKVLINCHAECSTEAILEALGLTFNDLYPDDNSSTIKRTIAATYDYVDENGKLLYQAVRYIPKGFSQCRPDGKGGWVYNLKGVERVLYRLPEVIRGIKQGSHIFLVEGEKDADNLTALGLVATTAAMGAGKWRDDYSKVLAGAKVAIMPDNDQSGQDHGLKVAKSLNNIVKEVKIINLPGLPPKGDVSDWLESGNTKEDLIKIVKNTEIWTPEKVGILLSEVEAEDVQWLCNGRIPLRKLTVLDGDPGLGKSTLTLDFAARVSTGRAMPDGSGSDTPAGVVILSAEDGLGDTIRPRLDAAGADCSRIVAITEIKDPKTGEERPPAIPDDLGFIRQAIQRVNAKLLIIDPLMAYLSGSIQSNRDQDVRRGLHRVAALAEETGAAVVAVRHLNKSGGSNAKYRGGGSIGIIGAARSGLLVAADSDDDDQRVLAPIKSNLCKAPDSLSFSLEQTSNDVAHIVWNGISNQNADALLASAADKNEGGALGEAKEVLRDILANGPVAVMEVKKEMKAAGIAERTLRRAKDSLGICSRKEGVNDGWIWELPIVEGGQPKKFGHLGPLGKNNPENDGKTPGRAEGVQGIYEDGQGSLLKPQVSTQDDDKTPGRAEGVQALNLKPQVKPEGVQGVQTFTHGHLHKANESKTTFEAGDVLPL